MDPAARSDSTVIFRLTAEQRARADSAAARCGVSLSEITRVALMSFCDNVEAYAAVDREMQELIKEGLVEVVQ